MEDYVRQGGTLIVGCRSGYKDIHGHCVMLPQPGLLSDLTGTDIREYTFVSPAEEETFCRWGKLTFRTPVFNDVLGQKEASPGADDFQVLAAYENSYYAGGAAITGHRFGKGRCIHVGCTFTRELVRELFAYTGILEPFSDTVALPSAVELVVRESGNGQTGAGQTLILLNYSDTAQVCEVKKPSRSLLSGRCLEGELILPPYGVEVLQ